MYPNKINKFVLDCLKINIKTLEKCQNIVENVSNN